jgi:hypothetical protein
MKKTPLEQVEDLRTKIAELQAEKRRLLHAPLPKAEAIERATN